VFFVHFANPKVYHFPFIGNGERGVLRSERRAGNGRKEAAGTLFSSVLGNVKLDRQAIWGDSGGMKKQGKTFLKRHWRLLLVICIMGIFMLVAILLLKLISWIITIFNGIVF